MKEKMFSLPKTIIYISGFGSVYKEWINVALKTQFKDATIEYYVLTDNYDIDKKNIIDIINKYDNNIHLIGHSTGGFIAINLLNEFEDKIFTSHIINAPVYLSSILVELPKKIEVLPKKIADYLTEQVKHDEIVNVEYLKSINTRVEKKLKIYIGSRDNIIDLKNMTSIVHKSNYTIIKNLYHRFSEKEFKKILKLINKDIHLF